MAASVPRFIRAVHPRLVVAGLAAEATSRRHGFSRSLTRRCEAT